ncbi:MAG: TlpA disulfide reductase family protein [Dehalococcoidia bacterium]
MRSKHIRGRALPALVVVSLLAGDLPGAHVGAEPGRGDEQTSAAMIRLFANPSVAPPFTVRTIDGRTIGPSDMRGKVVLVNYWATWCPPCRAEVPDLVALQARYADRLVIIGVSEDEGDLDLVKRFVAEHRVNYPIVMSAPELSRAFTGVTSMPTTFVLDRDGRVVQRHLGQLDPRRTELEVQVLAGWRSDVRIERFDPNEPIRLPSTAHVTAIPGVDLSGLAPEVRGLALQRLNAESCTCGCKLSVAKCRIDDPACSVSLPLARRIVDDIQRRKPRVQ